MRLRSVAAVASLAFAALASGATPARAESCPDIPQEEASLRRSMAREWFAKAEEAETSGDKPAAVRAYACSLNLTPHPSTAYNLGTVAEKSGDWSMAIEGFRAYLTLSPEAPDRPTIEARVAALEVRLTELRKELAAKEGQASPPAPAPLPTAPPPAPASSVVATPAPPSTTDGAHTRHVVGWITLVTAASTAGAGVALNLMARSKVDQCYRQWSASGLPSALDLCDDAKPFAYGSYALFGVGGALGATGLLLLLWPSGDGATESSLPEAQVSLTPTAGGATAFVSGRF
jgi:hypothetical protein